MTPSKAPRESLSKTPSWILLGFVIGCIVALAVRDQWEKRERMRPGAQVAAPVEPKPTPPKPVETKPAVADLPLGELEAVFEPWKDVAVWRHDITEVAFWNASTNQYTEYVEILLNGEELYFRSIPKLTRPLIAEMDPNAPLRLTETEEEHAKKRRWIFAPNP